MKLSEDSRFNMDEIIPLFVLNVIQYKYSCTDVKFSVIIEETTFEDGFKIKTGVLHTLDTSKRYNVETSIVNKFMQRYRES